MADKGKGSGGRGRWISILVVIVLAIGAWWVFDQWSSQPPATMPAVEGGGALQTDENIFENIHTNTPIQLTPV